MGARGGIGGHSKAGGSTIHGQARRLMETSNMFNMYRNSLKHQGGGGHSSNGHQGGTYGGMDASTAHSFSEPQANKMASQIAAAQMYSTTRNGFSMDVPGAGGQSGKHALASRKHSGLENTGYGGRGNLEIDTMMMNASMYETA